MSVCVCVCMYLPSPILVEEGALAVPPSVLEVPNVDVSCGVPLGALPTFLVGLGVCFCMYIYICVCIFYRSLTLSLTHKHTHTHT